MLYNAFLACGARHLALVNEKYNEDKALDYYNTATTHLLNALQNPKKDTVICATTAVILNVYEVMCERALQRMNHIAGARALIKECGWNARATGIGAACFWLNIGMELLSCLHFNWQVAWNPDEWGIDMDFVRETENGREEIWTHRMLYIVAKIANFRASVPRHQESQPQAEQMRLQNRYNEWKRLKALAESWNDNIPRTMHPMAYVAPYQTISGSNFPEVWLIKRPTIVARLLYHTAMVLLAQVNPLASPEQSEEMRDLQRSHSVFICGIVAHVKDRYVTAPRWPSFNFAPATIPSYSFLSLTSAFTRGVASVALRSLAIASECISLRREQEEIVQVFDKIKQETGWRIAFVIKELKKKWGWAVEDTAQQPLQQQQQSQHTNSSMRPQVNPQQQQQHHQQLTSLTHSAIPTSMQTYPQVTLQPPHQPVATMAPQTSARPRNPLLATADFNVVQTAYQGWYVSPNSVAPNSHFPY